MSQNFSLLSSLIVSIFFTFLYPVNANAELDELKHINKCITAEFHKLKNRRGIALAVVDPKYEITSLFGSAKENQIFEIGSITKTFTANILAQLIVEGSVNINDAIPGVYQKPGYTITYSNLTTHTSGIVSGAFENYPLKDIRQPYSGLTIPIFKTLYAKTLLQTIPGFSYSYSNIGASLLGIILAERESLSYERLVKVRIFKKYGMKNSYFDVPANELRNFPRGSLIRSNGKSEVIPHWNLNGLAFESAAGARSTIRDLIKYARINLKPPTEADAIPVLLTHKTLFDSTKPSLSIGMNWFIKSSDDLVWHNGLTYGFNSLIVFEPLNKVAVIALTDTTLLKDDGTFDSTMQDDVFMCLRTKNIARSSPKN